MFVDYQPKGVKFFYIYKALAHPETNGYVAPFTQQERLKHIAVAKKRLGSKIPWICDTIHNDIKHALGDRPNSEFIIDPEGKVVRRRTWSNPRTLRQDLEELVGKVDKPTQVADLNIQVQPQAKQAAKGVVPRLRLPGRMSPVQLEPQNDDPKTPFYVKLRAEASSSLLENNKGKLYLGFFLDPIYEVHWNNKAGRVKFTIESPAGTTVTPAAGEGPKIKEAADADPREFLVDVEGADSDQPLKVTVKYIACDDAETFCVPVTQSYLVHLKRDRDGGSRRAAGGRGGRGGGRPGGFNGDMLARMKERLSSYDKNKDGKLTKDEVPERMARMFLRLDANQDGVVDKAEIDKMGTPGRGGFGPPGFGPPGGRPGGAGRPGGGRPGGAGRPDRPAAGGPGDGPRAARGPQRSPAERVARYVTAVFRRYDKNNDGVLIPAEWSRIPTAADANRDGKLTEQEYRAYLARATRKGR